MKTEKQYEEEFDKLYEEGKIGEGVLDDALSDFRDDWIANKMREGEACPTCGGTGEVSTMERVYPNEPHMADIGTAPCPDCRPKKEEEHDDWWILRKP